MAIGSPILNRELLTFLRAKRAFVGLALFLLVLAIASTVCWWATQLGSGLAKRDVLSRTLFITVTMAQLFIFSAYALILTCTKINAEQDAKTFDLLASLPMTSLHIILAKYGAALVVIVLLVVASAPFLSLCFLLGGVGWQETLSAYCIIMVTVLTYGMMGVACSTVCRKNYVALFAAFLLGLFLYVGVPALVVFAHDSWVQHLFPIVRNEAFLLGVTQIASPFFAYGAECTDMFRGARLGLPYPLVWYSAFHFLVFIAAFLIALFGFRSMAGGRATSKRSGRGRRVLRRRKRGAAEPTAPPPRRRRFRSIGDRVNPIYAREDRLFLSRRWKHRLVRYALAVIAFLILWGLIGGVYGGGNRYKFGEQMCFLGFSTTFLVCLLVPLMAARMITIERETHTLPLLAVTRLSPTQIMVGKTLVLVKHAFRAEAVFTFLLLWSFSRHMLYGGIWRILGDWIKVLIPIFAITVFVASIGLFFSVLFRKTVTAIVISYGVIVFLAFSPAIAFIIYELLQETLHFGRVRFLEDQVFNFFSPIVSPVTYFIPENELNHWHENDKLSTMITYTALMLTLSGGILVAAAAKFVRGLRRG